MHIIKKLWAKVGFLAYLSTAPIISFADIGGDAPTTPWSKLVNPLTNASSIPALIQTLLVGLIKIGIPVIALAIIYCGFLFVAARGNPEKISKAKDALLYTIIGAAVLLGSWAIAQLISETVLAL